MKRYYLIHRFYIFAVFFVISMAFTVNPVTAAQENPSEIYETDISEEMEVLKAGPVHEAFAETSSSDTEPGVVVPKEPPAPIEEVPPDPEDLEEGSVWIPGYWAWDDDRNDFIWISGTWRVTPPGRQWVSGYWGKTSQGFQWTSGYWADTHVAEEEYLPEPPESLDEGPNAEAPSADYAWIPGCWVWVHSDYAWRPGYWSKMRPNWIWVPAYYVWTPHGYIYAGGYWDYPIALRGVLFAPVYFYPRFFTRVFFPFTPRFIIGLNIFSDHLFVRPRYRHYYFGDCSTSKHYRRGIYPLSSRHARSHGHDPIYAHQRYTHRNNSQWKKDVQVKYQIQRAYEDKQPQKIVRKKNKKEYQQKTVVQYKGNKLPSNYERKNKDKPLSAQNLKKKKSQKKIPQKGDKPEYQRNPKALGKQTKVHPSTKIGEKPKAKKVKMPKNEAADKKVRKFDTNEPSYKNNRASRPNSETASVQGQSKEPRVKNKNPMVGEPNPEKEVVVENSNTPRLKGRNNEQVYGGQGPQVLGQGRKDRIPDSVNRGNQRVTRGSKPDSNNQGKDLSRGRRNSDNRRRIFNSRR